MCDSKQKSSYENGYDFGRLRNYGHLLIPYTPSCEPRLAEPAGGWRTQLDSLSFALQALCVSRDSRSSQPAACFAAGGGIFENQL